MCHISFATNAFLISTPHGPRSYQIIIFMSQTIKKTLLVTYFSISGAQCTNSWFQNLKAGFLISSMKVIRRPQGCGLFTINRSKRTLEKGRSLFIDKHTNSWPLLHYFFFPNSSPSLLNYMQNLIVLLKTGGLISRLYIAWLMQVDSRIRKPGFEPLFLLLSLED